MRCPLLILTIALVAAACSGDDAENGAGNGPATSTTASAVSTGTAPPDTEPGGSAPGVTEPGITEPGASTTGGATLQTTVPTPAASAASSTTSDVIEVPATGVPGLDSSDRFCAAWSRFGGSWQVLLVGSTFLDDPETVARWEVAAASLIGAAYAELIATFPGELASEADAVADGYFGVLERRSQAARMALATAGATDADLRRLQQAWTEALATRDPATPEVVFVVPDDLVELVDDAAAVLMEARTEFHLDPSMVVDVETPLTDAYIESTCPDRGTLTGQEVDPAEAG